MDDLKGKVAIITGGGYGIGKKIAQVYAGLGVKLVLAARTVPALEETCAELKRAGAQALAIRTDVAIEADCVKMVARTIEEFGALDILVNNSGISGPTARITETSLADWQQTLDVNLTGAWLCAREALKVMGPRGSGNILNISSAAGRMGYPLRSPYVASKWAMIGLTQTLAREWGARGIRVNCICPGPVEGDRIDRVIRARAQALNQSEEQVRRAMFANAALGRMVSEEEVARAAVFLTSEASAGMTGQTLNIDAGYIMN
jgi:NAD(P)-dependent dehydrogenase (short-subunit alcohol dehydrogenase family)